MEQEYEDLKRLGYAGEGFYSVGARVGVGVSHDLPPHLAKIKAVEAAERRRKAASVMSGGGRLGGGHLTERNKSPRELAAEVNIKLPRLDASLKLKYNLQAAERRARDEKSCGSGHGVNTDIEVQRAIQDSMIDVDLLPDARSDEREASPEIIILDGPSRLPRNIVPRPSTSEQPRRSSALEPQPRSKPPVQASSNTEWSCPICTLLNPVLVLQCSACSSLRPQDPAAGWTCMSCGEQGMPHNFWSCRYCGQVKRES